MSPSNNAELSGIRRWIRWFLIGGAAFACCLLVGIHLTNKPPAPLQSPSHPATTPRPVPQQTHTPPAPVPTVRVVPSAKRVQSGIDRAATFLAKQVMESGRFVYRVHVRGRKYDPDKYNILRHAGSLYALGTYCQRSPGAMEIRRKALLATKYLQTRHIRPVPGQEDMLAVWSLPEDKEGKGEPPQAQAKLGGTGLGLLGLMTMERVAPGTTPLATLRKLARFIVFMQQEDGNFASKFYADGTRETKWISLYYPGEAMLGLLMLYEVDRDPQWLQTAARAMEYLARTRLQAGKTEPDHWALIATNYLLQHYDDMETPPVTRAQIQRHAMDICRLIIKEQILEPTVPMVHGSFDTQGRLTPASTRLEGLLAAFSSIPQEEEKLKKEMFTSIQQGISFILRGQIHADGFDGAFPRAMLYLPATKQNRKVNKRVEEIRIDYVQHAVSALMQYDTMTNETPQDITPIATRESENTPTPSP